MRRWRKGGTGKTYRASSNVSDLAAFNHVVESPHDFLTGGIAIQPVNLQHVDVGSQSLDTGVNGVEDVLAGQADPVDETTVVSTGSRNRREVALVIHTEVALGQDDNPVTGNRELLQGFANDLLGTAVGVDISLEAS